MHLQLVLLNIGAKFSLKNSVPITPIHRRIAHPLIIEAFWRPYQVLYNSTRMSEPIKAVRFQMKWSIDLE